LRTQWPSGSLWWYALTPTPMRNISLALQSVFCATAVSAQPPVQVPPNSRPTHTLSSKPHSIVLLICTSHTLQFVTSPPCQTHPPPWLPTAHCPLSTAHCPLSTAHCSFFPENTASLHLFGFPLSPTQPPLTLSFLSQWKMGQLGDTVRSLEVKETARAKREKRQVSTSVLLCLCCICFFAIQP
jgi:hypothetical protein